MHDPCKNKVNRHIASEKRTLEEAQAIIPLQKTFADNLMARLNSIRGKCFEPATTKILEIGSAQGCLLMQLTMSGYHAVGIEPWKEARINADNISKLMNIPIKTLDGVSESLPFSSEEFDIVIANSVIEHVLDVDATFNEVCRVLKKDGIFWFSAASSMCPFQQEIRGVPFFGWYPDSIKKQIMSYVINNCPQLIGYTNAPAINWFTPWKAKRMLYSSGFTRVYDRYDLRLESEGGILYKVIINILKRSKIARLIADIFYGSCSYAAIK
jgi:2-polyprenyl-3-methyl-5-hydroxy-6-metoxy-1,4-benzoquinol methylase